MPKELKPYIQAQKMDDIFNKTLHDHPITKDNLREWQIFLRVIETPVSILQRDCKVVGRKRNKRSSEDG